jgi:hypothetical protein
MSGVTGTKLFDLGTLLATPGALKVLRRSQQDPEVFFTRHATGDWGNLSGDDRDANMEALAGGSRVFSAYTTKSGDRVWVITEADRMCTTILLPEEY